MKLDEFEALLATFTSEDFLSCRLAGQELPYYVYSFKGDKQVEIDGDVKLLISRLESSGISVLHIDLFRMLIDILKQNDDLEWFLADEQEMRDDGNFLETVQGVLDVQADILPEIEARIQEASPRIIFLTGVGAMYPILRTHSLLNNLANLVTRTPVIVFFPGEFSQSPGSGASFSLFDDVRGDGYYRAFDLKLIINPS